MSEGTPYVSLQRTFVILLIVYGAAALFALLAGATLVAHVDPFSECILFSHVEGHKLYYGSEAYCETIGYLFLGCIVGAVVMFYITFKHRSQLMGFYQSGQFTKSDQVLTISTKILSGHAVITTAVLLLTMGLTAGYQIACDNISHRINGQLRNKLNKDPNVLRGEKIDERFTDDNQFWRYTGEISNPFGQNLYTVRMTCRTIFTDPHIHQELHDNHVDRYSNYFGYWYKQDLFAYDSRYQAVLTNGLIEASMAGGWVSVLLWGGAMVFMLIQKYYIQKEKRELDRVSLHSGMMDGSIRKDGSMFSGSGYYTGNQSTGTFQRGGLRGSNASMKSVRSRRDVDDLAFASLGMNGGNTLTRNAQAVQNYNQQLTDSPYQGSLNTQHQTQQYSDTAQVQPQSTLPTHHPPYTVPTHNYQPHTDTETNFVSRDQMETEIM
eukprot:GFUD01014200.1.p1 GENE.GFUD01014200.1~~GFUD01014200.1.p1  ORF type:complete len:436 (-),score=84.14 GFUD01014200.1:185-1492(-)